MAKRDKQAIEFGRWLTAIRERRGLTQEQLSDAAGTSQPAISLLECGERRPSWQMVSRLATALHIRPATVLAAMGKGAEEG